MSSSFKEKVVKSVCAASTILFLNQNLFCEDIIKQKPIKKNECSLQISDKCEYKIKGKGTLTISNEFIDFTSNTYLKHNVDQYDGVRIKFFEGNFFKKHKVFDLDINGETHKAVMLMFNDGVLGFYLFDKKMEDLTFFNVASFQGFGVEEQTVDFKVAQKKNKLYVNLYISNVISENYVIDVNVIKSNKLNIK